MSLSNNDLKQIKGGGFSLGTGLIWASVATFLIGLIDGFIRPLKCN